jgi:catechol 2,3-dioxygenase-like lactoylglutathione lyase family enzyme
MEILAARVLVRPVDPARSLAFYRDVLGLPVYREFPGGTVFFLGGGYLELSGQAPAEAEDAGASQRAPASEERTAPGSRPSDAEAEDAGASQRAPASEERTAPGSRPSDTAPPGERVRLWLQVRDLAAAHRTLVERGAAVVRAPRREPWGLDEMWVADPDGLRIGVVEVPPEHPLRRDPRS